MHAIMFIVFTCSIRATCTCVLANTSLTLRDTVVGEGMYISVLPGPVFIRRRNPRSVTMLKGQAFSTTQ
jgi:hypothetical protein